MLETGSAFYNKDYGLEFFSKPSAAKWKKKETSRQTE